MRTNCKGKVLSYVGHEGATLIKVGDKYIHLGTAWSTERGRHGSYNLYYCTAYATPGPDELQKFE